jgi:hypothetical protein
MQIENGVYEKRDARPNIKLNENYEPIGEVLGLGTYLIVKGNAITETDRRGTYADMYNYSISGKICRMVKTGGLSPGEVQNSPIEFFSGGFYLYKKKERYIKLGDAEVEKIREEANKHGC